MTPPELRGHLALALVPGLGPKLTAALVDRFGAPERILQATPAELRAVPLIGEKLAAQFAEAFRTVDPDREYAAIERAGLKLVPLGSAEYPARLATIANPPPLLYIRGELAAQQDNVVALVGSRACTPYGTRAANDIAAGLARAGWIVVSGLARGIDGAAHEGSLAGGAPTWAVLAGGLGRIYPPEHADLAARIVAAGGCLVTETPMTVAPQPGMFPARNRVISALSRMVVVVEADVRSGALITVEHANDQGREVGAVPGPVDSRASAGCLELLRTGATLIRHADDVLEAIVGLKPVPLPAAAKPAAEAPSLFPAPEPPPGPDGPARQVWDAIASALHADEIARATGLSAAELGKLLMQMELKRLIRRLPGNRYERR
jgi:DNA processing protein